MQEIESNPSKLKYRVEKRKPLMIQPLTFDLASDTERSKMERTIVFRYEITHFRGECGRLESIRHLNHEVECNGATYNRRTSRKFYVSMDFISTCIE